MNILVTHGPHAGRILTHYRLCPDELYVQVDIGREIVEFKLGFDCRWI